MRCKSSEIDVFVYIQRNSRVVKTCSFTDFRTFICDAISLDATVVMHCLGCCANFLFRLLAETHGQEIPRSQVNQFREFSVNFVLLRNCFIFMRFYVSSS